VLHSSPEEAPQASEIETTPELQSCLDAIKQCERKSQYAYEMLSTVYREKAAAKDELMTRMNQAMSAGSARLCAERLMSIAELLATIQTGLTTDLPVLEDGKDKPTSTEVETENTSSSPLSSNGTKLPNRMIRERACAIQTLGSLADSLGACYSMLETMSSTTSDWGASQNVASNQRALIDRLKSLEESLWRHLQRTQEQLASQLNSALADLCWGSDGTLREDLDRDCFRNLFIAYQSARLGRQCETAFGQLVIQPLIRQAAQQVGKPPGTSSETRMDVASELLEVWTRFLQAFEERAQPAVRIVASIAFEVSAAATCWPAGRHPNQRDGLPIDLLMGGCWPVLVQYIQGQFVERLTPAHPDVFHRAYSLMQRFEGRLYSWRESAWKQDASDLPLPLVDTGAFWRCWNLSAYFQVRSTTVIERMEQVMQLAPDPIINLASDAPAVKAWQQEPCLMECFHRWHADGLRCRQTLYLVVWMEFLWSESVFLYPLVSDLFRLTLRMVARFVTWIEHGAAEDGPFTAAECAWLSSDLQVLASRLGPCFAARWRACALAADNSRFRRPGLRLDDVPVERVFAQALERVVSAQTSRLRHRIMTIVLDQCTEKLQPLRGLLAAYRMMANKPMPTKPTPFIHAVLSPLDSFLEQMFAPWKHNHSDPSPAGSAPNALPDSWRRHWSSIIAAEIINRYLDMGLQVVESIQRAEAALRRLHLQDVERSENDRTADRSTSEREKILTQMRLDLSWLIKQLEERGERYGSLDLHLAADDSNVEATSELVQSWQRAQELIHSL
jgi:hypothetical protein